MSHNTAAQADWKQPAIQSAILIGLAALALFGLEEFHHDYLVLPVLALGLGLALVRRSKSGADWKGSQPLECLSDYDGGSFTDSALASSRPNNQKPLVMDGGSLKHGLFN